MKKYIAFDIGGTQIKYGIVSEIGIVLNQHAISSVGISTAGIVDSSKGMITGSMDHIPCYAGIPIVDKLQSVQRALSRLKMM